MDEQPHVPIAAATRRINTRFSVFIVFV